MRYSDKVNFYSEGSQNQYDPETGEYGSTPVLIKATIANVTDLGTDRSMALFGKIDTGTKVIRLPFGLNNLKWSYAVINGGAEHYVLQSSVEPLKNSTLIVGRSHG